MNARVRAWSAFASVSLAWACSVAKQSPVGDETIAFEGTSASIFAKMEAIPAARREALFTALGNLSLAQYYDLLEANATDEKVIIDGQSYTGSKTALVGARSAILALGEQFPNLSAWWKSSGTDPRAMTLASYQGMFRTLSGDARLPGAPSLALATSASPGNYFNRYPVKNPQPGGPCEQWNQMFALMNINVPHLIDGFNGLNSIGDAYSYGKNIVAPHVGSKDGIVYVSQSGPGSSPAVVFFPTRNMKNPYVNGAAYWDQGQYYNGCTTNNPDGTADRPEPTAPASWKVRPSPWEVSDYDIDEKAAS